MWFDRDIHPAESRLDQSKVLLVTVGPANG